MSESPKLSEIPPHELPWNVAVTFNPALGWPILRTQTEKLSATGAVICSDYGNLNGAKITLILESPPGGDGQTVVLRVRARVTSSVGTQQQGQYRHDVVFARSPDDRLGILDKYFGAPPDTQAAAAPPTSAGAALSHLDKLKALAQQKLDEEKAHQLAEQEAQRKLAAETAQRSAKSADQLIDEALQQSYEYFKELVKQLNVVKPDLSRQYAVAGLPEFRGLRWDGGRAHSFYALEPGVKQKRLERVSLNFTLSGGDPIRLDREFPASDRLKSLLNDYKIVFSSQDQFNARGSLERVKFEVPLTVDAGLQLTAKPDEGKIQINATHIAGFGTIRRLVTPALFNQATLNELSGYILGETSGQLPRLLKGGD